MLWKVWKKIARFFYSASEIVQIIFFFNYHFYKLVNRRKKCSTWYFEIMSKSFFHFLYFHNLYFQRLAEILWRSLDLSLNYHSQVSTSVSFEWGPRSISLQMRKHISSLTFDPWGREMLDILTANYLSGWHKPHIFHFCKGSYDSAENVTS